MKKLKVLGVSLLCVFALVGCSSPSEEVSAGNASSATPEESVASSSEVESVEEIEEIIEEETGILSFGETGELEGASFKINSSELSDEITDDSGFMIFRPDNGTFLVIEISVNNTGDKALRFDNGNFGILKGTAEYRPTTILAGNEFLSFESVNPGLELTGYLVYEVPADIDLSELILKYQADMVSVPKGTLEMKIK